MNPPDYFYIRAWSRLVDAADFPLQARLAEARQDDAPSNAVYRQHDGIWVTTDDIASAAVRRHLGLRPLPVREPDLAIVAAELRHAILLTERLRDLFGLTDVEIRDDQVLAIQFSTGWSIELDLRLRSPDAQP
jgi:hypothetical protein